MLTTFFFLFFADFTTNKLDCEDRITLDPGCEIVNGRCKCWKNVKRCKSTFHHWSYKNMDVRFKKKTLLHMALLFFSCKNVYH